MTQILFIPTMKCNLACPICHFQVRKTENGYGFMGYDKFHQIDVELKWYEWITYLNRFRPYKLEFTGGEPTIYPGFKDLIAHIPSGSEWSITSNTLTDLDGLSFDKCEAWTASDHIDSEKFIQNILFLKTKIEELRVSVVAEFANVNVAIKRALYFRKLKFKVNVLRELNKGVDWTDSKEWKELVNLRRKGINVVEDDIPPRYEFKKGYRCMAGTELYFCAMPDGRVYRCYADAMLGEGIGDIWNIKPGKKPSDCWLPCLACAKDYEFIVKKLEEKKDEKLIQVS